jgi:hypothetical protein
MNAQPLLRTLVDRCRDENLPRHCEARDTRAQINGKPFDADCPVKRLLGHLAHVDADSHTGQIGLVVMHLLQPQRKHHGSTRRLKRQKAPVASPIDNPAVAVLGNLQDVVAVARDQFAHDSIAALGLQRGRIGKVSEN